MLGLIDHGVPGWSQPNDGFDYLNSQPSTYEVYFGLGQRLVFLNAFNVFKISLAGLKLGDYLVRTSDATTLNGSFLDVGTGSGAHALLMRKLGNKKIMATDICKTSIDQAKNHEKINFKNSEITFHTSNLFEKIPQQKFQTVVFNPPGWRTPSTSLNKILESFERKGELSARTMFYGDDVITRFLEDLPRYLSIGGRAIVGLNSLVGIDDILRKYNNKNNKTPPLQFKLIERHTLPLFYYSAQWQKLEKHLKNEFEDWSRRGLANYTIDRQGNIYWSYEIIEFSHRLSEK
ncbi:MAG: methyltransferase [Pseudomonas proteolytica]|uniref:methyltransferase n=1 Tax=Pseudomonas proteolytica TaxID=219574 RepID=UPI003F324C0C